MGTAKYQQVINWIEEQMKTGKLKVGDRLDSENSMSKRFGISRQTVRHAISVLEQKGFLESRQGSGSYIKSCFPIIKNNGTSTKTVVIVSTYVNSYIFPKTIQGMERILEKADYNIRIMFTHNKREAEKKILKKFLEERNIDGMIIEPVKSALPNPNEKYYKQLQEQGIPILFFNSFYENCSIPHVSLDDIAAGKYMISALKDNEIGFTMPYCSGLSLKEKYDNFTFILVAVFFIGQQVIQGIFVTDNVSNMAHIVGGVLGGLLGYSMNKKSRFTR